MKVLAYVHLRRLPNCTGVGRMAGELMDRLAPREDVELEILADRADYARFGDKLSARTRSIPMRFFSLETSWQQARWIAFRAPKAEEYWSGVEVVWCPAESYVPTRRARLAVTIHDVERFEPGSLPTRGRTLQRMKWRTLFGVLERRADAILTVSQFSAERIAHYFPALAGRIHVVPHGVSERFRAPVSTSGEAEMERLGLKDGPFILVPGGLGYRKNSPLVLTAWALLRESLPGVKLVVSGPAEPHWTWPAGSRPDSITYLGYTSDELLRSLYGRATVVWFPSRYEGFGLPIVEAMACGAPVVTTRAAAIPEVAGSAAFLSESRHPRAAYGSDSRAVRVSGAARRLQPPWDRASGRLQLGVCGGPSRRGVPGPLTGNGWVTTNNCR